MLPQVMSGKERTPNEAASVRSSTSLRLEGRSGRKVCAHPGVLEDWGPESPRPSLACGLAKRPRDRGSVVSFR